MRAVTTIRYASVYQEQQVSRAEFLVIHRIYNKEDSTPSDRVIAIKFLREQYGLGLKEAKDVCDAIGAMPISDPLFTHSHTY